MSGEKSLLLSSAHELVEQILIAVQRCKTIQDFVQVYESKPFETIMGRMRQSYNEDANKDKTRDEWAYEWAIRMRNAAVIDGQDIDLNLYRRSALNLLYELCNAWKDEKSNTSVTTESIVSTFQGHRVENILLLALPLDRAQCLYAMKYPNTKEFGMHWVSSEHFRTKPDWEEQVRLCDGRPTMNKRLLWLKDLEGLMFGSSDIARWLEPISLSSLPSSVN